MVTAPDDVAFGQSGRKPYSPPPGAAGRRSSRTAHLKIFGKHADDLGFSMHRRAVEHPRVRAGLDDVAGRGPDGLAGSCAPARHPGVEIDRIWRLMVLGDGFVEPVDVGIIALDRAGLEDFFLKGPCTM